MVEKFCVIVDNEPQEETLEKVVRALHDKGIKFSYAQLNPFEERFLYEDKDKEMNFIALDKIKNELNTPQYLKRKVNLLACDYRFKEEGINGFDVILVARELRYSSHSLLYSGGLSKIISEIFDGESSLQDRKNKIEKLVKAQTRFIERETYDQVMIEILGKEKVFDFNNELEEYLFQLPNVRFHGEFSRFHEMSLEQIAIILRDSNDPNAYEFKKEFVERAFSIMIDLNTPQ